MADSALVSSMLGMVEGSVSSSNESTGALNSSDPRISIDRMTTKHGKGQVTISQKNITRLSLSQSTF